GLLCVWSSTPCTHLFSSPATFHHPRRSSFPTRRSSDLILNDSLGPVQPSLIDPYIVDTVISLIDQTFDQEEPHLFFRAIVVNPGDVTRVSDKHVYDDNNEQKYKKIKERN